MKKIMLKGMALGVGIYLMVLLQTTVFAADKTFTDYFPDPTFARQVAENLEMNVGSVVTQEELDQIVNFDTPLWSSISSIEGVSYLRNVKSFELNIGSIKELPAEIGELSKLEHLTLYANSKIEELPPEIGKLSRLTSLYVEGNALKEIPAEIEKLSMLTSLTLDDNEIKEIPAEIGELSMLTSLSLDGNAIEELPPEIGKLSRLTSLSLYDNAIEEIPAEIGNLSSLRTLYLNRNKIEEIPSEIADLGELENLFLSDNQISGIPDSIQNVTSLYYLDLSGNQIQVIPGWISKLENLSYLSLNQNQIEVIPDLEELDQLYYLGLSDNQIQEIPESLGNLRRLEQLGLSNNKIEVVPDNLINVPAHVGGKESLDLSGNLIKELPDSFGTTQVQHVFLSGNQISRLPDSFGTVQVDPTVLGINKQHVQLPPASVRQDETITSEMLVPEIVLQLTQYPDNGDWFGQGFGQWEIVTPDQEIITRKDQVGNEDMSELFQVPGTYEVSYTGNERGLDFQYYHAAICAKITSSISITVLPEQKKTHQVDVTVRYLDDARAEETKSYTVDEGEAFEQQIDVLDGYALANMGLFRAFFDFDYDTDRNVVSLSPVDADHSILLEFDKAQYRVRLKTTYLDGSQADSTQVSWIPYGEGYQQSYQIAEGYEIANMEQLAGAGIEIDEATKTVHMDKVTQNQDVTLEFQKKSCEVIVRVVYEDGAYPDQVSTYPVNYGDAFKGDFSYDDNYAIRKVSFNATGVSVNRISKQINIGSVTDSVEIIIVVR